ncbi:hypothetical protein [Mycobacterium gordonae]|uniref:Lipoprotein n=1 Tax=Mycobacterium gordonae TaxID=1778 RepID=A0A1X1VYJ5_MYCGO|nr:hypothetical protein [Mycobacterium gordonae]PJE07281.1 MAG: hypothetical protein CK429_25540 [Mycobacterium sp.]MBX9980737.1 hypothetical protein [Mycobacterium gordonae]MCV7010047.1 hypothetical protein [Mycobacterium gordonae]ODR16117.1 hypothetical protein BHQ23_31015 [Mycobacterium gordonae]ORV75360.1 hypothetical protein AWC08_33830 [Mycobacterium gordonae]
MRVRVALIAVLACCALVGCSGSDRPGRIFGAQSARIGESVAVLGWNISVSNLRWGQDFVLVDVDAAPADPKAPRAKAEDVRFGLYGALSHPMEANALGSCDDAVTKVPDVSPLKAPPDRLTGTVCLGPLKERSAVRGIYAYSPHERIAGTSAAYAAAFPVGLPPTNVNDTGLVVKSTNASGWRADGLPISKAQLSDPTAFNGNGYMLLNLEVGAIGAQYRDDSARRGGPLMLVVAPSLPNRGLNPACAAYGSSVLILPDASRDSIQVNASLCTSGEISQALLYATVSIEGTHAAVWTAK